MPSKIDFICTYKLSVFKNKLRDFAGGAVVKNPPANAGDMDLIPVAGRPHTPQSN